MILSIAPGTDGRPQEMFAASNAGPAAAEVQRIARERGMDMKKIMDHYHIDRLDQMTSAEYADFVKQAPGGVNG